MAYPDGVHFTTSAPKKKFCANLSPVVSRQTIKRELARMGRPAGSFNAQRYFRGDHKLRFYNTGTEPMRAFARALYEARRGVWSVDDAMILADELIVDDYLETKSVGIEVVARFHRSFMPKLLPRWKRWLAGNHSANWATTDSISGQLIGPLLVQYPALAHRMRAWSKARNMWVRRASVVGLIAPFEKVWRWILRMTLPKSFTRIMRISSKKQSAGRFAKQAK